MICIKSIEVFAVDGDVAKIANFAPIDMFSPHDSGLMEEAGITVEMVRGRVFSRGGRHRICIGMSKQVLDALELPLDVYEKQQEMISALEEANASMRSKVRKFKGMTFVDRLKFLFTNGRSF